MDFKLISLLLIAVLSLTAAEYFTIQAFSEPNKANLIKAVQCRDAGGIPVSHTYILDKDNKPHNLCLHPSSIIELE